jgi:hypothetical protein
MPVAYQPQKSIIMKKNILLPIAMLLFVLAGYAQPQPVGHLTIFSEDGDKFYLVLNGERQNNVAQTNLRVEDLTQDYYNAKIIFEDKNLPEINKTYLAIADANGVKQDVTYKIKKDKNNGKLSLKYFSMTPVVQGYVPPSNVYVTHYGTPVTQVTTTAPGTTTTVTETTTVGTPNTVNTSVNVGGVGMNVTITDPLATQTTTTTTQTTHTEHTYQSTAVNEPPRQVGCVNAYPMASGDFASALSTIKGQGFDESKLKTAKQIASSNCLNASQITQICQAFGFEETKLDFAKYAYDYCTEPKNYFKINNVFSFTSSSDELNEYVQSKH